MERLQWILSTQDNYSRKLFKSLKFCIEPVRWVSAIPVWHLANSLPPLSLKVALVSCPHRASCLQLLKPPQFLCLVQQNINTLTIQSISSIHKWAREHHPTVPECGFATITLGAAAIWHCTKLRLIRGWIQMVRSWQCVRGGREYLRQSY